MSHLGLFLKLMPKAKKKIKAPLFMIPVMCVLFLLAACSMPSWMPFFGKKDTSNVPVEDLPEVVGDTSQGGKDTKIRGEDEFLRGDYVDSYPLLVPSYRQGNLRAVFYMRIILQYGLQGDSPNLEEAERAKAYMALKYNDIYNLSRSSLYVLRPLYYTAMGYLYYNGLVPGSPRDLNHALTHANNAISWDFMPATNLFARITCDEEVSTLFGLLDYDKTDCFDRSLESAQAQDILAMGNVSALYREGIGTNKDPLQAVNWAHLAAHRIPPSARAQNDMGYYYETGASVSKDIEEAKRYYALAEKRYPLAKINLDRLSKGTKGPGGPPSLSQEIDY